MLLLERLCICKIRNRFTRIIYRAGVDLRAIPAFARSIFPQRQKFLEQTGESFILGIRSS
jgi:hypothetical protein